MKASSFALRARCDPPDAAEFAIVCGVFMRAITSAVVLACVTVAASDCSRTFADTVPARAESSHAAGTISSVASAAQPTSSTLYVSDTCSNPAIEAFPTSASGNVAPTTTIAGANTTLRTPYWLSGFGEYGIGAADYSAARVLAFPVAPPET